MKNFIAVLCVCVLVLSCTGQAGKNNKASKITSPVAGDRKNTLLWKVSGNGLNGPSYIFGTMHLLCSEDALLSDSLKKALRSCDKIYMELDMDNLGELMGMMGEMKMKGGKTLKDIVSPGDYQRIKDFFSKQKSLLPFSMMEDMKPLLLASTVMEQDMQCKGGGIGGMEMSIMEENRKDTTLKKEILGLESIKVQTAVFDSIPYEKQAKELLRFIDSGGTSKGETAKLLAAYKSQNLDTILELTQKSEPGLNEYMDLLLYRRNRDWVRQLKAILPQRPVFVAVGAAHLVGDAGVLALLRKEGFTLTPVNNR
jgi:uncharacterized protein